jgi:hypothetical protein
VPGFFVPGIGAPPVCVLQLVTRARPRQCWRSLAGFARPGRQVSRFPCSYSRPGRPVRLQLFATRSTGPPAVIRPGRAAGGHLVQADREPVRPGRRPCLAPGPWPLDRLQRAGYRAAWPAIRGPRSWWPAAARPGRRPELDQVAGSSSTRWPRSWWPCLCLHVRLARVCDPGHKPRPGGRDLVPAVTWWPTATWCLRLPGGQCLVDLVPGSWSVATGPPTWCRWPPTRWRGPRSARPGA